jgi:abequosyltransferase
MLNNKINQHDCPKVSICIPTYNRSSFLKNTLDSICCQDEFLNSYDIEIVISDNDSTDSTAALCLSYLVKFPEKIKYFKNDINIGDKNFEIVLRKASGQLRKLINDTLIFSPHSLKKIIELYEAELESKKILFFANRGGGLTYGYGLNNFLVDCSYHITWIGGFSIWKEHLQGVEDFHRFSEKNLSQVDVVLNLLKKYKGYCIVDEILFQAVPIIDKKGYDFAKVFLSNYFEILIEHNLSMEVLNAEKRLILCHHVAPIHAMSLINHLSQYDLKSLGKEIKKHYLHDYLTLALYIYSVSYFLIRFLASNIKSKLKLLFWKFVL